ncbi:NEQ220 [Nanoarchaeum equitans Kin4-M]|uniref:Elongation factor 1-beta n=1 Tax=Nanoarchaeum equitans (strain Kin4-M) TaxID=228908 RepID=EF1B_NANEQ|nr:RecName: Full=Elongation factor 1-beta; Short=EF-1-beta; AltName: Full=aEF-1beta [Nanoarchaeum equitans Kin4-M]AAR39073.1 NEQ220 [Nanoarchaeum equitans Kin4-M]
MQIIPESPEVDLDKLLEKVKEVIKDYGEYYKHEVEPLAFGLKSLIVYFLIPETSFNEEQFLDNIKQIEEVSDAEILMATRA